MYFRACLHIIVKLNINNGFCIKHPHFASSLGKLKPTIVANSLVYVPFFLTNIFFSNKAGDGGFQVELDEPQRC